MLNVYGRCDKDLLRKTDDIDILLYPEPTKSDFMWNSGSEIVENIREKGHITEVGKPRSNIEILVNYAGDTLKKNPFFLHFSRNSKNYLKIHGKRLKNQMDNGVEKQVPCTGQKIWVESPEDIVLGKLPRRMNKDLHDIALLIRCVPIDLNYMKDAAWLWYNDPKIMEDMLGLFDSLYGKYKL
jgi:hypothetical protein